MSTRRAASSQQRPSGGRLGGGRRPGAGRAGSPAGAPAAGCSPPTTRSRRCRRWPAPGAASSVARWSGSPARPARPRSRTSPGDPADAGPREPRELQHRDRAAARDPRRHRRRPRRWCWRWRCGAAGQIAELCEIAEPDVGAITNVGPVHLELLGTLEAIAEAKAEILGGLRRGGRAVIPADGSARAPSRDRLGRSLRARRRRVRARGEGSTAARREATIGTPGRRGALPVPLRRGPQPDNALCAIAIGVASSPVARWRAGAGDSLLAPARRADRAAGAILLVNDCYNANPISMRAALDHLARCRRRAAALRCSAGCRARPGRRRLPP